MTVEGEKHKGKMCSGQTIGYILFFPNDDDEKKKAYSVLRIILYVDE